MAVSIAAIANCDDAVLFWSIEERVPDCFGFAITREQKLVDGEVRRVTLHNRTGFAKDHPAQGETRPSTIWPFQRFSWADHSANTGDKVRYRVSPMVHVDGQLEQRVDLRSEWTPWLVLSADAGPEFSVFFNRGLVISQFMARYLEDLRVKQGLATREEALRAFKQSLDHHDEPIRKFLGGTLRDEMLALLATAKAKKQHVFAALYELDDEELVGALAKLGTRGHLVLSNGSIAQKKGEELAVARKRDQNKTARAALKKAGLEMHGRFVSPGALGHNKFLVITNAQQKPIAAWTGSTNWTKTGLCTQINNGLLVEHRDFAQVYLDQWQRLAAAGNAFPTTLVDANSKAKPVKVGASDSRIWCTRARNKVDLAALDDAVSSAKDGILFLMFQPGGAGTLGTVKKLLAKSKQLYVKGVVSTLPPESAADESAVDVSAFGDGETHRVSQDDIVQPAGHTRPFANFAAEVTRKEFLGNVGFAIVHSKLIVIDPFTKPIVITGSHNFSTSASGSNDENFVIVRGNSALALAYAAHVIAVYQHYRWRSVVQSMGKKKKKLPEALLVENDAWQARHLTGPSRRERDFWVR